MTQITLRNLPEDLDREIRNRAKAEGLSLNRTIVRLLKEATGIEIRKRKRDLSNLAGTWTETEAEDFESHVKIFEELDREIWK